MTMMLLHQAVYFTLVCAHLNGLTDDELFTELVAQGYLCSDAAHVERTYFDALVVRGIADGSIVRDSTGRLRPS